MNHVLLIIPPIHISPATLHALFLRLKAIKGKIGKDDTESGLDFVKILKPDSTVVGDAGWVCQLSTPYPESTFRVDWIWSQILAEIKEDAEGAPIVLQLSHSFV